MFHCLDEPQFIQSPTEGHLVASKFWQFFKKAAINTCTQAFVWTEVFNPCGAVSVLHLGHSNRCAMVSHCGLRLHLLNDVRC